jgi:hypothetical protein
MNARSAGAVGAVFALFATLVAASAALSTPHTNVPSRARPLGTAPVTVTGTANGGIYRDAPVPACAATAGVVWYTVEAPHRGAMVARLVAKSELDGAIVVYRVVRSQRIPLVCAMTNTHGRARVAWYAYSEGSYLIGVVRRQGSAAGPYELSLLAADAPASPPGALLPSGGAAGTTNGVLDTADAWSIQLERGTTYKLNLTSPGGCLGLDIYRPGTYSFAHATSVYTSTCAGYDLFTPGIDGGGLYSLVVRDTSGQPVSHYYRLGLEPAGPDDSAPGLKLDNGQFRTGTISGRTLDAIDLYRFSVPRGNELTTLDLRQRPSVGFDLLLLTETGGKVACACNGKGRQVLRERIPQGRYYVAVRSREKSSGEYGLQLFVRDVTATTISVNGAPFAEVMPGAVVPLTARVTSASHGGAVVIEIDRHDPLSGWQFSTTVHGSVDASGNYVANWTPAAVGHWRARARFVGTPFSSFSKSGYVRVHVAEPLE